MQRYKSGWGVVCGLDVRRSARDEDQLVVSAGYAVSCCGDDLVLCSDELVDPGKICLPQADPCEELGGERPSELFFDLVLQANEEPTAFETALGCNDNCRETGCEPSRVIESATVALIPVGADKSSDDPVQAWLDGYQEWWRQWVNENQYEEEYGRWWYRLLEAFWRFPNHDGCHTCHKDSGIPLARICVRRDDDRCVIAVIDAHPPARRPLALDGWPVPWSMVNFAQFLGRSWPASAAQIYDYFHHHGITMSSAEVTADPQAVMELLTEKPVVAFDSQVAPVVVEMGKLGQRVVGFRPPSAEDHQSTQEPYEEQQDLTKLYGIGLTSAEALYEANIYRYQQILDLDRKELQRIVKRPFSQSRYERCMADARRLIEEETSRE
ncbi:MAG: hypothetical protein R3293_06770 [Candidatus Promineifilaceae bacterium]|nr:hypothetical protein [Candidatus Promineifilaceae bacterium]